MTSDKYWLFLEELRRSGETNMYGAAPYLAQEFQIPLNTAVDIVVDWMRHYDPDDYRDFDSEVDE